MATLRNMRKYESLKTKRSQITSSNFVLPTKVLSMVTRSLRSHNYIRLETTTKYCRRIYQTTRCHIL
jgi:hypothetical protein